MEDAGHPRALYAKHSLLRCCCAACCGPAHPAHPPLVNPCLAHAQPCHVPRPVRNRLPVTHLQRYFVTRIHSNHPGHGSAQRAWMVRLAAQLSPPTVTGTDRLVRTSWRVVVTLFLAASNHAFLDGKCAHFLLFTSLNPRPPFAAACPRVSPATTRRV
jgi:hypothetical protein